MGARVGTLGKPLNALVAFVCLRPAVVLIIALLLMITPAISQENRPSSNEQKALASSQLPSCQFTPADDEGITVLTRACQSFLDLTTKLPDYLCEEKMVRRGPLRESRPDVIVAQVRFSDGHETYSDVTTNGRPADHSFAKLSGFSSFGEFASLLRAVFDPRNRAEFSFRKAGKLDSRRAFVYDFTVKRGDNKSLWFVNFPGFHLYPGYNGRLWLDPATARPMRVEMQAVELPKGFPFPSLSLFMDYADVPLGDGTSFVLPVQSQSLACDSRDRYCLRNKTTFTRCRKFGAEHRILPD